MEKAFAGPAVIAERMGGRLDVAAIADADPEQFAAICARPPAVHRFPGSMAKRVQATCRVLVDSYDGTAANFWAGVASGAQLRDRIAALPGFGAQKAAIFTALLGKRYGVRADGWREAAGATAKTAASGRLPTSSIRIRCRRSARRRRRPRPPRRRPAVSARASARPGVTD